MDVTEGVAIAVINGLNGPASYAILLVLVLYFVGKTVNKFLDSFSGHLSNIEKLFSESKQELANINDQVLRLSHSLDKHVLIVDTRIKSIETRLERMEDRK